MIDWLDDATPSFPPLECAMRDPNGLLAAGGRLEPEWLLAAYRRGIFPWYSGDDPILWWSPDPRMVLAPSAFKISRSLQRTLRRRAFEVRCDTAFSAVMAACAAPREPGAGTWITPEMHAAYCRMHELGWAHSVESWIGEELVGGLYGMAIGQVFFGESMFARRTDASKVALAHLVKDLERRGFTVIDCQMNTAHLASLGATEIARNAFVHLLEQHAVTQQAPARWAATRMQDIDWGYARP
ncbi:leucyl/phenylalanyl-tRNA--protein transferase [Niveibacterium sp. 24ML]|uniref:leucyl/phenylalanyl-tRNA--protein transferase n=1 Tax=Niveibacterium sp. 24ML TaxID=2985512 RepID=UPI00226D66BE|nr:leucyl/phenylalanyl-tRNA--protein transferase [Niveibacterium sp. 24ML]MCX9157012.1 leucyl/phenylalanyl-tRNA--protein transferase [Niveibacterium sp. 24ML]